jgi:hypothetical protein
MPVKTGRKIAVADRFEHPLVATESVDVEGRGIIAVIAAITCASAGASEVLAV